MTSTLLRPVSSATVDGDELELRPGSRATLDAQAVPYAVAELELPLVDEAVLDDLDPRSKTVRVPFEHTVNGGTPRPFDLLLRSRVVDHDAKTVRLRLASDEALLQDYATLTADAGARAHEASLRAVVDYVLAKIGAALEPGAFDADVTAQWAVTNLLTNPSVELVLAPWTAAGNCALFHAGIGRTGGNSAGVNSSAAGTMAVASDAYPTARQAVTPGRKYVYAGYGRKYLAAPNRTISAVVRFYDVNGATNWPDYEGAQVALSDTAWTARAHVIAEAPVGAVRAATFFRVYGSTAAGQIVYVDDAMFYEGDELVPFYTGSTAADARYTYAWSKDPHASYSTRTPTVARPPSLFRWQPGVKAWDFLVPLTSAAGMVLWCDELREWHLSTPEARTIVDLINVRTSNTRAGTDTLDVTDGETVASGVVVQYEWTDADGIARTMYDAAGTPDTAVTVEMKSPYPGPGAAAEILARRQGTGRRQDVDTVSQVRTTPGMTAQISLPGAPDTAGRIASVDFDLASGFMRLGMAGLVDIIPGSIAALPGTIDSLVGTIDSL